MYDNVTIDIVQNTNQVGISTTSVASTSTLNIVPVETNISLSLIEAPNNVLVSTTSSPTQVTVVATGTQGPKGDKGDAGTAPGVLPNGITTGDFVRYNKTNDKWEVSSEPIPIKGLVLTPAIASLIDAEGAIYYNSSSKAVMVCTNI